MHIIKVILILIFTTFVGGATEVDNNRKVLAATVMQLRADSHVVSIMLNKIQHLSIVVATLPTDRMATTELKGADITISVDVAKVLRNHQSLVGTIIHELTHAEDLSGWPLGFARVESEDRSLPWAERRLERRAIQRTGIITGYLAMQFPDRYTSSVPIVLE